MSQNNDQTEVGHVESTTETYRKLVSVASIAAGVQFGWALQLSLLTPYVQLLGVTHTWSSFVWLCGPMSGLLVQPIVGYYSDACTSRFGKRRPFIIGGAMLVIMAVIFIGFAADFGHMAGDSLDAKIKARGIVFFVFGFWILDVANNMLQGPCRAFLADICNGNTDLAKTANAFFAFFMGLGNILGYSAGSYGKLYTYLPFTKTDACDIFCANLKTCFIIAIVLLLTVTTFACATVSETPQQNVVADDNPFVFFISLGKAIKQMKKPMWILLAVTCMNWVAWFPWLLYNTDWMGKEVFGGVVGNAAYGLGVQTGSLGLMLNSVVLLFVSIAIVFVSAKANGVKILWAVANFVMAIAFVMTMVVTKKAEATRQFNSEGVALPPSADIKAGALTIFFLLGFPIAVTFSIPFALASMYCMSSGSSGGPGQGLSLGVLNLAIVIPQIIVSVTSGPFSALFGGGNTPVFVAGGIAAFVCGVLALVWLPKPSQDLDAGAVVGSGGH